MPKPRLGDLRRRLCDLAVGYLSAGHAPVFDWSAATPWWICNFVPNFEA